MEPDCSATSDKARYGLEAVLSSIFASRLTPWDELLDKGAVAKTVRETGDLGRARDLVAQLVSSNRS